MKIAACVIVKNEAPNFLEWICFHLAVGFDTILVYDNHSTDRTFEIAEAARAVGDVRAIRWESEPRQIGCYAHALDAHRAEFDWMAFIDSDEFLFAPGERSIKGFLARRAFTAAFAAHWLCYGSSGAEELSDRLVIEEFVQRAPTGFSANRHIKSLLRPALAIRPLNGHKFELKEGAVYRRGDGVEVTDWLKWGKTGHVAAVDRLRINHYFTRSQAHYRRKLARGDLLPKELPDVFTQMDRNDVRDESALVYEGQVRALMARVTAAHPGR